jgi:hypothetical protein
VVRIQDIDLIKQFVDKYNSVQASIDGHKKDEAKKKYKELLGVYNKINTSDLDKEHKELAFEQVMKTYKGMHSIRLPRPAISKSVILAGIILLLSVIVFVKPEIIGFAFEPGVLNQAPVWDSYKTVFNVRSPETRLNLNEYFFDPDGDELTFLATEPRGVKVEVSGPILILTPSKGVMGPRDITMVASDGQETAKKQVILNVIQSFDLV